MAFCRTCGKKILDEAEICVNCGVRVTGSVRKSKTLAVVLAAIFGLWAWLYTYKEDAVKFWVSLVLCFGLWFIWPIPSLVAWILAIIDMASRDSSFYENYKR